MLLSPLLLGAHARAVRVAGVAIGEPAARVDRTVLTGADEAVHSDARVYADGTVYRVQPDGTRAEIPLGERVDAVLAVGGVLRSGAVALRVDAQGVVAEVFVRGEALATLDIAREEDIAARFGPATGHQRELGWRRHHYPERGFSVAWHVREARLEHVALTPRAWKEPLLGAPELLRELLDAAPTLAAQGWTEPTADGSARVRFHRISALARALGLPGPAVLVRGNFLGEPLSRERRAVLDEITRRGPASPGEGRVHPAIVFAHLFTYRVDVERVVRATDGWLACSDPALLGMIAEQNQLGARLTALMVDVDRWMVTLLDPRGRTFELRALIAAHGWPDVDLRELELDEL